jgi:hypothetical protein
VFRVFVRVAHRGREKERRVCVFSAYPEFLKAADCLQSLPSMVSQLLLLRKRER